MKKKKNIDEELFIDELDVSNEIKDNLKKFNDFILKVKKKKDIYFNIVIDNMPNKDIDIYLEYVTKIMINEGIVSNVIDYKDKNKKSDNDTNNLIIAKIEDLPHHLLWDDDDLFELFSEQSSLKNILLFATTKKINLCSSFKKLNVINIFPIYRITYEHSVESEYSMLIDKYKENKLKNDLSQDNFKNIYEKIKDNDYVNYFGISNFLYNYSIVNKCINNNDIVTIDSFDSIIKGNEVKEITSNKKEIKSFTGLDNIKKEINRLLNYVSYKKKINSKDSTYLNLFFLGNPGTGKTMVANMISTKLFEMGFLEKDEVIKVVPTDLIGEYVGQTRDTAREVLNKAHGKLLFIDEAYLLYNSNYKSGNNPYMDEAIVELMKYLEDPKNIVIFAGYAKEMRKLYDANPGLKSRIYKEIEFNDYTKDELYKILSNDLEEQGLSIDKSIKKDILNYIDNLKKDTNFGNARSILKLSQELIMNHSNNSCDTFTITKEDIPKYESNNTKRMGFDA